MSSLGFPAQLDRDVSQVLAEYLVEQPVKLRDWIPRDKLNKIYLASNTSPSLFRFLESNPDLIDWHMLMIRSEPEAIELIEKHPEHIDYSALSMNAGAIHLLEKNLDKVDWYLLSRNPAAADLLERNRDKAEASGAFEPRYLYNPHQFDFMFDDYEDQSDYGYWRKISGDPQYIKVLEKELDHADWYEVAGNPAAIHIIESNLEKINYTDDAWMNLSRNPAAIELLEQHQYRVNWDRLCENPAIFEVDHDAYARAKNACAKAVYDL